MKNQNNNKPAVVLETSVAVAPNPVPVQQTDSIARAVDTLERLMTFRGERIESQPKMTTEESVRLGVAMINRGEESKARGVIVLADKARSFATADDVKSFFGDIKSELINEAKHSALSHLPLGLSDADRKSAEGAAEETASKRFDNLRQAVNTARWMLTNPDKVADGVSVYTVVQAKRFLALPDAKDTDTQAIREIVLPMLASPTTTQGAIKRAIATKALELKTAKAPIDDRSDEKKAEDAIQSQKNSLCNKVCALLTDWENLLTKGVSPDAIRCEPIAALDKSKGTIASNIATLAKLAGVLKA